MQVVEGVKELPGDVLGALLPHRMHPLLLPLLHAVFQQASALYQLRYDADVLGVVAKLINIDNTRVPDLREDFDLVV